MLVEHKCGWSEIGKIERTRVVVLAVDASLPAAVRSESQLPTAGIACKLSELTQSMGHGKHRGLQTGDLPHDHIKTTEEEVKKATG